ncbi:hypothetical protein ACVIEM_006558 [Rhizobium leguminosarum]
MASGFRIDAITGAKHPKTLAGLVFDDEVVRTASISASRCHHSPKIRSGPSARLTFRRLPRQVIETGGRSGNNAMASISSGCASSRTGRRQWLTQVTSIGSAAALMRWTERSGTSEATGATR